MRWKSTAIGVLTGTILALGATSPSWAQAQWRLGTLGADGTGFAIMADLVAERVSAASGGAIAVQRQFIGNEQEMVQQVLRGRIQMGATSPQGLGVAIPDGTVLGFPFLWDSDEERDYVMANYVVPIYSEFLEARGLHLLVWADAGYYGVFCKFDCSNPATVRGVPVRVSPTSAARLFWDTRGAVPVQLALSDLWPGLEQNLVRAADIPLPFYITTPARESAPHFVATNHFHAAWLFFINSAVWGSLSTATQEAIMNSLPTSEELIDFYAGEIDAAVGAFTSTGGRYYVLDEAGAAAWRQGVPERLPELLQGMGPDAQRLFDAIQAGKAAFAAM